ncbi:MAG: helix-turn-helix transcriptional regulator [Lachnospiraceae bacterium]|nr:helix-turn-helix transcriptional regulator [Lachnospiraceae bacterium]
MTIGDIIKKYRKNKGMTQEEMAARLGVTAPAVNKWERGNTLPDVALLAPIARLLGITTDELLSFKDDLTDEEISQYLLKIQKDLESKDFHDIFLSVKEKVEEYPNCEKLIWQAAVILDAKRMTIELPNQDKYDKVIFGWYERCLLSKDKRIRNQAADSLFHAFIRQEDYEKAAQYLDYFSLENPDRKRKEALVNSKTGKRTEAYRAYEELIFSAYQHIQMTLNDLRILYMEDDDHEMARKLVEVSSSAASTFEMGKYNEICFGLDVAAWEKDIEWTAQLIQEILDSIGTIGDFTKSKLYQHMALKTVDSNFSASLKRELLKSLEDESFHYMQGNEDWEKLKSDVYS